MKELIERQKQESLMPIARGGIDGRPYWNTHAKAFGTAPAFGFPAMPDAVAYRYTVTDADGGTHIFNADQPDAALSAVWLDIPVGITTLTVEGLDTGGNVLGTVGQRSFYRNAVFNGVTRKALCAYKESAFKALDYLYKKNYVQHFLTSDKPDHAAYTLFCYPSKILGRLASGMLLYSKLLPEERRQDKQNAMTIARKALNYLLSISEPEGRPLEYMPPTYEGTALTAGDYAGTTMIIYPAQAAMDYLDFLDATGDKTFLDAAMNIAATYAKLQLPCGSWYLKLRLEDGSPVASNIAVPLSILFFLDRLERQYGILSWHDTKLKAEDFMQHTCMAAFDWEGQFEDSALMEPYGNLTLHTACDYALYLLQTRPDDPKVLADAIEMARFSEDQFIIWEKPFPQEGFTKTETREWILPCGLEQYSYYVPIDTAALKVASLFHRIYCKNGDAMFREKARALANTMTHAQDPETGRYMTYWENNGRGRQEGWLNCMIMDAEVMLQLQDIEP